MKILPFNEATTFYRSDASIIGKAIHSNMKNEIVIHYLCVIL
jgi:hypothetical protein